MNVTTDGDQPGWLLHQAALFNSVDLMKSLLEGPERSNINAQDSCGRTPLYTSVSNNSLECCSLLLTNGADANLPCGVQLGGMTSLHSAAAHNNFLITKLLLESGADLHKRDASGKRPLEIAEANRSTDCIYAIQEKMDRDRQHKERLQKEFIDACVQNNVEWARRISMDPSLTLQEVVTIVHGYRMDDLDLLYRACDQDNEAMCEFLLQNSAPIVPNTKNGQNAFHVSCLFGHMNCARLLIQQNPEIVNIATFEGSLPIHLACLLGQVQIVKFLLTQLTKYQLKQTSNVDRLSESITNMINARDLLGQTPLHIAASNNHVSLVQYLLDGHLVIDSSEMQCTAGSEARCRLPGESLIHLNQADDENAMDTAVDFEVWFSVDVDADNLEGKTPFHLAVLGDGKVSYCDIVAVLLQHNASPNRPLMMVSGSTTALMEAVQRSDLDLMDLLLLYGAKDDQLRVLKTAIMLQDDDAVGCLIKHRTYLDSEFKVNHKRLMEIFRREDVSMELLAQLSESFAITICWHGLSLQKIALSWLQETCRHHMTCRIQNNSLPTANYSSFCFSFLTRIDVSSNSLSVLPSFLFLLPSLRILNASCNQIRAITKVCKSGMLERDISPNLPADFQLEDFDDDIDTDCPLLEDINLHKNQLFILPTAIFKLPSLKRLNASDNLICSLPFDMWMSSSLVELNLSSNRLDSLPCFSGITTSECQASVCGLSTPLGMEAAGNSPTTLFQCNTNASSVTESLNGSVAREELDQKKDYKPVEITYLNCWQERLQVELTPPTPMVEEKVEQHSQLKELILSGNQLEEVPHGLPCLAPNLEKLSFANNRFTQIGAPELYPARLKSLDLSDNLISNEPNFRNSSPINIKFSTSPNAQCNPFCCSPFQNKSHSPLTTTLSASNPMLRRLSSSTLSSSSPSLSSYLLSPLVCTHRLHRQLNRLKSLKLDGNRLKRFRVYADTRTSSDARFNLSSDGSKKTIVSLDYPLSRTPSTSARDKKRMKSEKAEPKDCELLYPNLILLDLSNNEIEFLPPDICDLTQLAELKISSNKIRELPPEMGLMKKLWFLDFTGCPVETTLRSLLGEKATRTLTVLSYLKSVREEAKPFNRMKLMFVGKQGIGKTSLLNQLRSHTGDRSRFTHWAQRMGHDAKDKDQKGENISTVGVDIGTIEMQRGSDKVIFSTWDFGGQREYYATHQYFLSKRSLYLVVWKVTDGEEGVNEIMRWLINIQARAPNSPVIIVGTHRDALRRNYPKSHLDELGELIERKYIQVTDPDKLGLPRVMGHLEVSCKGGLMSRTYISQLVDMIWKVSNEEHQPGNPGLRLLDQLVPACYLHLQDVIIKLAEERKQEQKDPVLYGGQYKLMVIGKMEEMFGVSFQDISKLNQATQFLHENGILLHYEDISLRDIYFLDPQWLCDMLANVITIREINGLVRSGLMMADDLKLLFKGISFKSQDIKSYIVNLLQKFEVALLWNESSLIIPSLLPTDRDLASGFPGHRVVAIPVQGCGRVVSERCSSTEMTSSIANGDILYPKILIQSTVPNSKVPGDVGRRHGFIVTNIVNPAISVIRLYVMSYLPSGFWPRLITRLLGDPRFYGTLLALYNFSGLPVTTEEVMSQASMAPCWSCWQTGAQLKLLGVTVLQIREVTEFSPGMFDYRFYNLVMKPEDEISWTSVITNGMSILEILIPNEALEIEISENLNAAKGLKPDSKFVVYPDCQAVASLLAKIVDCVDLLLEDWYPDIGIRFTQNTRGMYLITRLVPCTRCFLEHHTFIMKMLKNDVWSVVNIHSTGRASETSDSINHGVKPNSSLASHLVTQTLAERIGRTRSNSRLQGNLCNNHLKDGVRSFSCDREVKRGVKNRNNEVPAGTRAEFSFGEDEEEETTGKQMNLSRDVYCYTVEQCLQVAQLGRIVFCPRHGNLGPFFVASSTGLVFSGHVASDTVFHDIGENFLLDRDSIILKKFLGKGAFGAVFSGSIVRKHTGELVPVALKMLQPIKPPAGATYSQQQLYDIERARWDKDPLKNCCEAYLNARKELSILLTLRHEHMVPLIGVSVSPLCLVLSLAPLGALSTWLQVYLSAGARLPVYVIRQITLQVSSALEYLHGHQVIYRDLKSENVLVWSLPPPHCSDSFHPVSVKLADYGVSRVVLPFGTKGFAGTVAFMAPEIMQHSGEETYTEKVDCFSFGMFMYELLLLRVPYEDASGPGGSNINIKGHVLSGYRPAITSKEVSLPSNILDLMTLCWSHDPADRPSAAEIVAFIDSTEFSHLCNAVMLDDDQLEIVCGCSTPRPLTSQDQKTDPSLISSYGVSGLEKVQYDVWIMTQGFVSSSGSLFVYTYEDQECVESKKIDFSFDSAVNCMCVTKTDIWCACTKARLHVFRRSDYSHILSFSASSGPPMSVQCMTYGEIEDQVYVVLGTGQFVIYNEIKDLSALPESNEYPGNKEQVFSMTAIRTIRSEVWCGQSRGRIQIWRFRVGAVFLKTLVHAESCKSDTSLLVPSLSDSDILWSHACPVVCRWSIKNRCMTGQIDLSEMLVPYSDPALTTPVQSLNAFGSSLYIGMTSGHLVIIDAKSLSFVNACLAHEHPLRAILPLSSIPSSSGTKQSASLRPESSKPSHMSTYFVTVGRGYRDLVRTVLEHYQRERNSLCGRVILLTWTGDTWLETTKKRGIHVPG